MKNIKKISTTKKLIIFLFANCTIIELYTMIIVFMSLIFSLKTDIAPDFSPLVALIGAIIGEVIGYAVYCLKSAKENSIGGIIYESAMQ